VIEGLPRRAPPLAANEDRVADGNDVAVILGPPLVPDVPMVPIAPAQPAPAAAAPAWSWSEVAGAAWLAGTNIWSGLTLLRVWRFRRLLDRLTPDAALQERTRPIARRLGLTRCPAVYLVAAPISPLVWALGGRARVLVPAGLWHRLGDDQRNLLLAHELAHLRRGDPWVRLVELIALGL